MKHTNKDNNKKKVFIYFLVLSIVMFTSFLISFNCNKNKVNVTTTNNLIKENKKEDKTNTHQIISECIPKSPDTTSSSYSALYSDMYCKDIPEKQYELDKTIYLTFDDGPSERTNEILDVLAQKNIKATFFVTGQTSDSAKESMKRIVSEGHTIGIHTYSHVYSKIYASVETYLKDFNQIYDLIYNTTGVKTTVFRFPGGSKNSFNKNICKNIINEMLRRGFFYYDWNISSGDASSNNYTPESVIDNVLQGAQSHPTGIVLMHDCQPKKNTVKALPALIDALKEKGFMCDKITNKTLPIIF